MASCSSATILVSQTILGDEQCMQLAWNELKSGRKNKRWMMVFFVMERKKTDALLQPWASSRPRLAGASQVVFIMRQSRIQILGCGCSLHLADWTRRSATWRRWEAKVQKTHTVTCLFETKYFLPPSVHRRNSAHVCVLGGGRAHGFVWCQSRRHKPRVRLQYQQRHDDAAQHQSACINDTRPAHFTVRVQILTGIIHQRAQDRLFYEGVSDTFTAPQCYA